MTQILANPRAAAPVDTDALLSNSYLLVTQLHLGSASVSSQALRARCTEQVEWLREQLQEAGMSLSSRELISHAQCAMLDEAILGKAQSTDRDLWMVESLQARFFGRHQAGETLYEEMRSSLAEPAPDLQVLTVYQRILMLGFKGRYATLDDPQRLQLLAALDERVAPLSLRQPLLSQTRRGSGFLGYVQSLRVQLLSACALLAATWWGLDQMMTSQLTKLLPGQG